LARKWYNLIPVAGPDLITEITLAESKKGGKKLSGSQEAALYLGGICLIPVTIIALIIWANTHDFKSSSAEDEAKARELFTVTLQPVPVYVKKAEYTAITRFARVQLEFNDATEARVICGHMPLIMRTLHKLMGDRVMMPAEWKEIILPAMADDIRHRINVALNKNYVDQITVTPGQALDSSAQVCPT